MHLSGIISWFRNPPNGFSSEAADTITRLWLRDSELGNSVAKLPWLVDGIDYNEHFIPRFIEEVAAIDIELAKKTASIPWLEDQVDTGEPQALGGLKRLAAKDIELARLLADFHWYACDVTRDKLIALQWLDEIATIDLELAGLIVRAPWLADDLTLNGLSALTSFRQMAYDGHIELAKLLAGFSWFADGHDKDLHAFALNTLANISVLKPDNLYPLTTHPWFVDGLDDQEAALVVTLSAPSSQDEILYEDLLQEHFLQSRTISLSLAGEVNIWVIQNSPFPPDDNLVSVIEDTVRISERLMGVPFPTTDIILLVVVRDDNRTYNVRGQFLGSSMILTRYKESPVASVPHETAHYYSVGPTWYSEGGSEFIEAYVNDLKGVEDLAVRAVDVASRAFRDCVDGSDSIENLWYLIHVYGDRRTGCHYGMGESFLLSAYVTIGEEAMSAAMRELYLSDEEYDRTGDSGQGRRTTEEAIYDAFLKHAPAAQKEAFRDLYRRLHGGPYAYPDNSFSDDHGDEASGATAIEVGEAVEGVLDYRFDFDYFRFRAQEGQKYRINVNHGSLHFASITLYAENDWLIPQIENWVSRSSEPSGPEMLWIAPSSDEFYFVVRNIGGESGAYTLKITPIDN